MYNDVRVPKKFFVTTFMFPFFPYTFQRSVYLKINCWCRKTIVITTDDASRRSISFGAHSQKDKITKANFSNKNKKLC